ncbi:TMEM43 family protein [Roseiconus lacunae]|uniref:TMEM43 family protein n=1 Tax=Roseiconus lacunae TaxID=2605694 RepID=UPI0011F40485|nr:TMEM43 family protein [Roseiconus lacunae]
MGTHVTDESWFGRLGGAFKGILFGGLIALVSVPLLFWNEGRAVRTAKGLKEGASVVVEIKPDEVVSENEGKFVHVSGHVSTDTVLTDEDFGISFNGIRLKRHVQMYQWKENRESRSEKKLGGGKQTVTEYSYEKGWYDGLIDSSEFDEPDHQNPTQVLFSPKQAQADNVRLGEFHLPSSLVKMIGGEEPIELDDSNLPAEYRNQSVIVRSGDHDAGRLYIFPRQTNSNATDLPATEETVETPKPKASTGANYLGLIPSQADAPESKDAPADYDEPSGVAEKATSTTDDQTANDSQNAATPASANGDLVANPEIGDVRIWFTATPTTMVSLLSQQAGDSFAPYQTQYGTEIHTLETGAFTASEMISHEQAANRVLTWVLRGVGAFMMFLGFVLMLRPLEVIADVVPMLGSLVGFGTSVVAGLLTVAGSMTVIGIAWVFYRPVLGVTLLVIAAGAIYFLVSRGKKRSGRQGDGPETLTSSDLA